MELSPNEIDRNAVPSKDETDLLKLIENLSQNGMLWEREFVVLAALRKYGRAFAQPGNN